MAQPAPKPLPIVWYLDATDLLNRECTPICIKLIVDAVARWEADGNKTLDELRKEIDYLLDTICP